MILHADARHIPLADESVQTVVTSPPYWGLRDYGIAASVWGGREDCGHEWGNSIISETGRNDTDPETLARRAMTYSTGQGNGSAVGKQIVSSAFCLFCSAWRGVLGLEPTPELYVEHIVEVFREVRRVLRKDGTVWLNLGDSYAGNSLSNGEGEKRNLSTEKFHGGKAHLEQRRVIGRNHGLKPKDLVGIPWRCAFALQADGWYLRSDIIWNKPNPMPESVTDRPTKSHEYIFLLAKSERYYYDAEAIREPITEATIVRISQNNDNPNWNGNRERGYPGSLQTLDIKAYAEIARNGRNKRSVWTVATQPYPEAHFATFPEELIKPCILAGAPVGGIVLDPFVGSGTTVQVSQDLGRIGIGLDLKPDYLKMARRRSAQQGLILSP